MGASLYILHDLSSSDTTPFFPYLSFFSRYAHTVTHNDELAFRVTRTTLDSTLTERVGRRKSERPERLPKKTRQD